MVVQSTGSRDGWPSRLERRVARGAFVLLALGVLGLALWLPFRDRGTLLGFVREQSSGAYTAACDQKAASYLSDVRERRYLPQRLRIRRWESPSHQAGQVLGETLFASMLARRATPFAIIEARGGLGKSKLAAALEARLCGAVATFRLDVGRDLLPRLGEQLPPGEVLEQVVAELAGVKLGSPEAADLRSLLERDEWVLLVDSLDEVASADRPRVIAALNEIVVRYGRSLRLAVFTRPPVYAETYGLAGVHAWLGIEPLDCAASDERVRFALKNDDDGAFRAFAAAVGLDARSVTREACRYVHLATFRDLFVAVDVARDHGFVAPEGLTATRGAIYGAWIDGRLKGAGLEPAAARAVLGGLVAAEHPEAGTRTFVFTREQCLRSAVDAALPNGEALCALLAKSGLAKPVGEGGSFRFDNQSVADYFLAAWADDRLEGNDGAPACERLADLSELFESNEVAGFLLGLPRGGACAEAIVRQLWRSGAPGEETSALVEQGLGPRSREIAVPQEVRP
jgi:hypothetical protein